MASSVPLGARSQITFNFYLPPYQSLIYRLHVVFSVPQNCLLSFHTMSSCCLSTAFERFFRDPESIFVHFAVVSNFETPTDSAILGPPSGLNTVHFEVPTTTHLNNGQSSQNRQADTSNNQNALRTAATAVNSTMRNQNEVSFKWLINI